MKLTGALMILPTLLALGCVPKKDGASGANTGRTSQDTSPLFTLSAFKVGANLSPSTDVAGIYYSQHDPVTLSGACRGGVIKVRIEVTPNAGATTTESVNCTNTQYSWSKSLTTETSYDIVLSPLDASDQVISTLPTISKEYVYDVTDPGAPTFLTPTTSTSYSVNNGQTSFTITGQVPNDVDQLIGPGMVVLGLTPNVDGIHKDFSYSLTVNVGATVTSTFLAYDKARNESTSSMSITSILSTVIPIAATTSGGGMFTGGHFIYSTSQFNSGVHTSNSVTLNTGTAATLGSNP